jgi:hypothetical protein
MRKCYNGVSEYNLTDLYPHIFWQLFDNFLTILGFFFPGETKFLTTFWQLFDNFLTTFWTIFWQLFVNFLTTFWQLFWQLFDSLLTTFWQLCNNFLTTFLTIFLKTFLTTFANFFNFFILMVVASCCNKYYGTNFISAVPTSLLIAPGLRTIQLLFM